MFYTPTLKKGPYQALSRLTSDLARRHNAERPLSGENRSKGVYQSCTNIRAWSGAIWSGFSMGCLTENWTRKLDRKLDPRVTTSVQLGTILKGLL